MSDDDPRHGTNAGYLAGCRVTCCRKAHAAYRSRLRQRRYLNRGSVMREAIGSRRRIQALVALGWNLSTLDVELGAQRSYTARLVYDDQRLITENTAERIAALYERLSMTLPDQSTVSRRQSTTRARRMAERKGWAPPLAWDDIDLDDQPAGWPYKPAERIELLMDLLEKGAGVTEATTALNLGKRSLEKWCHRHGCQDLYRSLCAREDVMRTFHNQWTKPRRAKETAA